MSNKSLASKQASKQALYYTYNGRAKPGRGMPLVGRAIAPANQRLFFFPPFEQ